MRVWRNTICSTAVLMVFAVSAAAQGRLDVYFGLGTAHDGSSGLFLDLGNTGNFEQTPSLGGIFGTIGGGFMLTPSLGVGGEVSFRFDQGNYSGLGYRPIFYDFNGIWTPTLGSKRIMPEIQGGLGGVNLRFYGGGAYSCDYYTGQCSNFAGSSNHFQFHAGVGLRLYVTPSIFIRPQFDYHWVHNFSDEFASDSAYRFGASIGFSTGQ